MSRLATGWKIPVSRNVVNKNSTAIATAFELLLSDCCQAAVSASASIYTQGQGSRTSNMYPLACEQYFDSGLEAEVERFRRRLDFH